MSISPAFRGIGTDFLLLRSELWYQYPFMCRRRSIHGLSAQKSRNAMISLDWQRRISEDLGNELKSKDGRGWRRRHIKVCAPILESGGFSLPWIVTHPNYWDRLGSSSASHGDGWHGLAIPGRTALALALAHWCIHSK